MQHRYTWIYCLLCAQACAAKSLNDDYAQEYLDVILDEFGDTDNETVTDSTTLLKPELATTQTKNLTGRQDEDDDDDGSLASAIAEAIATATGLTTTPVPGTFGQIAQALPDFIRNFMQISGALNTGLNQPVSLNQQTLQALQLQQNGTVPINTINGVNPTNQINPANQINQANPTNTGNSQNSGNQQNSDNPTSSTTPAPMNPTGPDATTNWFIRQGMNAAQIFQAIVGAGTAAFPVLFNQYLQAVENAMRIQAERNSQSHQEYPYNRFRETTPSPTSTTTQASVAFLGNQGFTPNQIALIIQLLAANQVSPANQGLSLNQISLLNQLIAAGQGTSANQAAPFNQVFLANQVTQVHQNPSSSQAIPSSQNFPTNQISPAHQISSSGQNFPTNQISPANHNSPTSQVSSLTQNFQTGQISPGNQIFPPNPISPSSQVFPSNQISSVNSALQPNQRFPVNTAFSPNQRFPVDQKIPVKQSPTTQRPLPVTIPGHVVQLHIPENIEPIHQPLAPQPPKPNYSNIISRTTSKPEVVHKDRPNGNVKPQILIVPSDSDNHMKNQLGSDFNHYHQNVDQSHYLSSARATTTKPPQIEKFPESQSENPEAPWSALIEVCSPTECINGTLSQFQLIDPAAFTSGKFQSVSLTLVNQNGNSIPVVTKPIMKIPMQTQTEIKRDRIPNFPPGKPVYWMNKYYPDGIPLLTKTANETTNSTNILNVS